MPWAWFAKRFPRRLTPGADFARMARNPSYRAPHPRELLDPQPFALPEPRLSPEERQLLDAVLADPDADAPRLRYAEWCDRQGDPRGDFIRQQCKEVWTGLTGLTGFRTGSDPVLNPVNPVNPVQILPGWVAPFAPWSARDIVFRRGFAEAMSLSGRAFISLGEPLFRLTPLREVRLVATAPFLDELAAAPHLTRLSVLDLRGNGLDDSDVAILRQHSGPEVLLR